MKHPIAALALALAFTTGCGSSFVPAQPPEFVEVENDHDAYDHRATTADGLVMAVREIEHDPQGKREFWVRAVENRLRDQGGYALLEKREVKNAQGIEGTQLRFGHDEGKTPHLYYVTLFVTEDTIFVLEAGGTKELVERHAQQIDWSIQNFYIK